MEPLLNEYEVRVVSALVEKQITTPDYYPLTLNALVNACNQKNNRQPVVSYDEETVSRALGTLRERKLAFVFHGSEARVAKYGHVFPKAYDLTPPELAVICVLMLRGPQTVGEIRGRSASLYNFESLVEVEATVEGLVTRDERALVSRLPRLPGMKEPRYAHLFSGEVELESSEPPQKNSAVATSIRIDPHLPAPEKMRVLEETISNLRSELDQLKAEFAQFRKQFE